MSDPQQLPVLPSAHARALALLQDEAVQVAEIASVVESDPALTTAVLRAANSAASAPVNRITVAQLAVTRIGLAATKRIVTAAVVNSSFTELRRGGLDTDELWRHLVACALLTEDSRRTAAHRSSGFTGGLLHDIGRMAMAQGDPHAYRKVVALAASGADVIEAEIDVYGYDHQEWGVQVALEWELPDEIVEVIGDHHAGDSGPLSRAARESRRIASTLGIGDGILPSPESGVEIELTLDERLLLSSLGGELGLLTQVEWLRYNVAA